MLLRVISMLVMASILFIAGFAIAIVVLELITKVFG